MTEFGQFGAGGRALCDPHPGERNGWGGPGDISWYSLFSANAQSIVDAGTRLVAASARSAPGNKADAPIWPESDLPAVGAGPMVIANGVYPGTSLIVPRHTGADPSLLRRQKEDYAEHRQVTTLGKHAYAGRGIGLRNCRQKGDGLQITGRTNVGCAQPMTRTD